MALLLALSAFQCGGAAGAMARGCGKAGSGARAAGRAAGARAAAGAGKSMAVRGAPKLGVHGGAMAGADDVARLGLDERLGAYAARSAADEAALSRLAEHSLDLVDLAQLALDDDEILSVVDAPGVEFDMQGAAGIHAPVPGTKVRVYSFLRPSSEAPDFALFQSTFALREVLDFSAKRDALFGLDVAAWPASFVVTIAPEWPSAPKIGADDPHPAPTTARISVGLSAGGVPLQQSVQEFALRCVSDTQVCVVLGCDPHDQIRCGMAALDLVHACREREQAFSDCLRARGDADPRGPSVSVALKRGTDLRLLRSTRTMGN